MVLKKIRPEDGARKRMKTWPIMEMLMTLSTVAVLLRWMLN